MKESPTMSTKSPSWMRAALMAAGMMVPVLAEAQTSAERGMLNQIVPEFRMGAAVDQQKAGFRAVDRSEGDRALLGITAQASVSGEKARRGEKSTAWSGEAALLGGTRRES
jgi:hypothetical protein